MIAAALALGLEAVLTGAFHEDALADFADAFGGGATPERTKEILKDSRIGSYGALAICLAVFTRWAALATLPAAFAIAACAGAGAAARFAAVGAMAILPPAADRPSLAKDIGERPTGASIATAVVFCAAIVAPLIYLRPAQTLIGGTAALAAAAIIIMMMKRKLNGSVGDGLGAIAMLAQTLILVAFSMRL
jgi:adenosylcobinamide-GDP ribazoletransferase